MTIKQLHEKVAQAYRKLIAAQAYLMAVGVQHEQAADEADTAREEYELAKAELAEAEAGEEKSSP